MRSRTFTIACVLAAATCSGCTSVRETFPGHDAANVWTAMVAVAQSPDYIQADSTKRWTVRENDVWVDEPANRIEVFRRLERQLWLPGSRPRYEARDWSLQIVLEDRDPPTACFTARNASIPAHAWSEAERYFADVRRVLGGTTTTEPAFAPAPSRPADQAAPPAAAPAQPPQTASPPAPASPPPQPAEPPPPPQPLPDEDLEDLLNPK